MDDAFLLRGLERIIIAIIAGFVAYLGYSLFKFGVTDGRSKVQAESEWVKLTFSGTAPGLFFMLASAVVLVVAIFKGGVTETKGDAEVSKIISNLKNQIVELDTQMREKFQKIELAASGSSNYDNSNLVSLINETSNNFDNQIEELKNNLDESAKNMDDYRTQLSQVNMLSVNDARNFNEIKKQNDELKAQLDALTAINDQLREEVAE